MVACVRPPLYDIELVDILMGTLKRMYFEKMVGSMSSNFSYVITIGEHIENGLKARKIFSTANQQVVANKPQSSFTKKKEGKTSVIMLNVHPQLQVPMAHIPYYPYVFAAQYQQPPFEYQPSPQYQQSPQAQVLQNQRPVQNNRN